MLVWECTLRGKTSDLELVTEQISDFLRSDIRLAESGEAEDG